MGEFLDRPARLSLSLREREGNVGITPDNYQILPPSSNHIYIQVGLARQVDNYTWWHKQAGEGEVVRYHQHFLEVASRELVLLVDEGQRPLETAKMAVDLMGTRLEKEQERKQQRIETLLAAAAAVLSVLTLLDKEAVRGLLEFLGVSQPISIFPVLGVQFGLIVLVALLAILVIRLIRARRPR